MGGDYPSLQVAVKLSIIRLSIFSFNPYVGIVSLLWALHNIIPLKIMEMDYNLLKTKYTPPPFHVFDTFPKYCRFLTSSI